MSNLIYYRIAGNAATFGIHSVNSIVMLTALQDEIVLKDPDIKNMASMQSRFLTIWNIAFQMVYAGLALTCDLLTVIQKDHLLPKPIKKFRDVFYSSIVFPGTMVIFTVFWPIFLVDRSLIFPEFIDKVFTDKSNFVMHFAILPFVLWELAFQPRTKPKSNALNLALLMTYYTVYNIHIHLTYNERGVWPYPLINHLYGTIYYPIVQISSGALLVYMYYLQWPLYSLFWGKDNKIHQKSK